MEAETTFFFLFDNCDDFRDLKTPFSREERVRSTPAATELQHPYLLQDFFPHK